MIRAKNKFYRLLKLDNKTQKTLNFFREIKQVMLKTINDVPPKNEENK